MAGKKCEVRITEVVDATPRNGRPGNLYFLVVTASDATDAVVTDAAGSPEELVVAIRRVTGGTRYRLQWHEGGHPNQDRCPSQANGHNPWWDHKPESHPTYTRKPEERVIDYVVAQLRGEN